MSDTARPPDGPEPVRRDQPDGPESVRRDEPGGPEESVRRDEPDGRHGPGAGAEDPEDPGQDDADAATGSRRPSRRVVLLALFGVLLLALAGVGVLSHQQVISGDRGPAAPGRSLVVSQGAGTSLTGIGALDGLAEPCTAWLLDTGAPATTQAVAVTTGRCAGIPDTGTVLVGESVHGVTVALRALAPDTDADTASPVPVPVEQVLWASGRWQDRALLRLGATYGELAQEGVRAIPVGSAQQGDPVLVAGVPVAGIAPEQQVLRGSRCEIGPVVDVLDDGWYWQGTHASDCTGILAGSAGSPVLDAAGRAVGMVVASTVGAADGHDCVADRPCEVRDEAAVVAGDTTYVTAVDDLAGCLPRGVLVLGGSCPLELPDDAVPATAGRRAAQPGDQVAISVRAPGRTRVAVRTGAVGTVDCTDPLGWSAPQAARDWAAVVTLPTRPGWTLACVGSAEHATPVLVEADATPPDPGQIVLDEQPVAGGVRVAPTAAPPDLVDFRWVVGPGRVDCATAEGYVAYADTPGFVQADDLPATVCVIGVDDAGNASDPAAFLLE